MAGPELDTEVKAVSAIRDVEVGSITTASHGQHSPEAAPSVTLAH